MIILAYGFGNHSNRLLQNIHFEAFCKEYGIEYINPSFLNMHKYYLAPCKLTKGLKGILFLNSLCIKILRKLKLLKKVVSFDTENQNTIEQLVPPPPPMIFMLLDGILELVI